MSGRYKRKDFYAVRVGRKTGIFTSWEECKEQVTGFKGAVYKGFKSEEEANKFLGAAAPAVPQATRSTNIKRKREEKDDHKVLPSSEVVKEEGYPSQLSCAPLTPGKVEEKSTTKPRTKPLTLFFSINNEQIQKMHYLSKEWVEKAWD
jgi:hypothetical protein